MILDSSFPKLTNDLLKNSINSSLQNTIANNADKTKPTNKSSFLDYLTNAVDEVNKDQIKAYDAMRDIALNKTDNLQEAVQKIEEAELSLKLALEIQNKTIGAYKEIMRIQV
jgi:flagellar hook-basal body complex protein FliE